MTLGAGTAHYSTLLEELTKRFGSEKVITDYEDLYVYSFFGPFGIQRRQTPIVVLRLDSESQIEDARRLVKDWGIQVSKSDDPWERFRNAESETPLLLIDSRKPINRVNLRKRLSELKEAEKERKLGLKNALSFSHWFTTLLKMGEGYRISESPDLDYGFCMVQHSFDGAETFSAKGRLLLSRGLLREELRVTKKLIDSLYSCTTCGQCYDQLRHIGLEVHNAIARARHRVIKEGMGPKQFSALSNNVLVNGNPFGMPTADRTLWFEELADEFPFNGNDLLYWTGCSTAYRLPNIVKSTTNVLQKVDVGFGLLGNRERCCGLVLYLLGLWDEARKNALETSEMLSELGVKALVTSCAGCYYAFTRIYPMLGVQLLLEVRHTSQFIESLILGDRLEPKGIRGRYVWHDPCDLGRHCKIYEEPRNVLRAIPEIELKETPLNREHTLCCGAGGGLWVFNGELTEKMALSKLSEEIMPTGIDGVVTGCPSCILNLKYAAKALGQEIMIYDLTELVNKCL